MSTNTVSTAFQRAHVDKKPEGTFQYIGHVIDEIIINAVPEAVKDMPKRSIVVISILGNLAALILFCSLVFISYNTTLSQVYLSPSLHGGVCQTVARPLDGTFLADTKGNWQSSSKFSPTEAVYQFKYQQLVQDMKTYEFMIDILNSSLYEIGDMMENYTLAENLIIWTSWGGFYDNQGKRQNFNLYSDPSVIFNRQYISGLVSNQDYDCNEESTTKFDSATYIISISYPFKSFFANPTCSSTLSLLSVNYVEIFDGQYFSFNTDIRSMITALAINTHIIYLDNIAEIPNHRLNVTYLNQTYTIGSFYDPKYPG